MWQILILFSNFRREYLLKFDDKFEVQDDFEVLKRMGLLLGGLNW